MDVNKQKIMRLHVRKAMDNLEKNNYGVSYVPQKEDIVPLFSSLIEKGSVVGASGSVTLSETGLISFVKQHECTFIDRFSPNLTKEELYEKNMQHLHCDIYLASANAITQRGEIYCVDGSNNRLAALLYGPKKVYIIVGHNKIVTNVKEGINRVKQLAAPANATRLDKDTYCVTHGHCVAPLHDDNHLMSIPPHACDKGICSSFLVLGRQGAKERIHVIIVGEDLGY